NAPRLFSASDSFNPTGTGSGDKVFVAGGLSPSTTTPGTYEVLNSTEILSLDSGGHWVWSFSTPLQTARMSATATLIGTRVLVAGGWPWNAGSVASSELYETTTGTFVSP